MSSVVGFASDVAGVEVLFTSLLVQSQVALRTEAAGAPPGSRLRRASFRSSFLLAYAERVGERLAAVNDIVETDADGERGGALLPILAARTDAVDDAIAERFGELCSSPVRGGGDGLGWFQGRQAADRAQLSFGDIEGEAFGSGTPDQREPLGLSLSA